ncbi:Lsr2 protein [Motilibacter rhizosphaerae]|uniref:Lsr2 protein n=1 Tax=Motilibacter rhizosphaerae TaxID=598652 RepID=A0A4Q7NAE9_9ACTN|nr:Lsr2 family protein [Motilibacter rhizosphaerae]RZS79464.1 Lsr2 protein [Motilibacter rhizosphaerae]
MAQRTIVTLEDDIDGGEAEETVTFALDGVTYEIDLNEANAARLRDALAPYVGAGRRVGGRSSAAARPAARPARAASSPKQDTGAVREWARANGFTVSDRGRIPGNVVQAFEQAHS